MQSFVPNMAPTPGERLCRFVGDRVQFHLRGPAAQQPPKGWRALLRTNLGRASALRREILEAHTRALTPAGSSWRDLPMTWDGTDWSIDLPLTEVGYFKAKAYALDPRGWQHWPAGQDVGISVHPNQYRTGNTLYCAFTRLFGEPAGSVATRDKTVLAAVEKLDQAGYAAIPPSGKLRDLAQQLPHIMDRLGCRILHLLPVSPTPTTYARFGRFGSPYAALDLTAIDPALVVFDKRSTGIDQFRELTYAAHLHGGSVFLDIVINHTGWSSVFQELHPDWFVRQPDGQFVSPGAWGTTWEDLIELKHQNVALWDNLSEIFLTWCARGVDGFRCDAGYMVPVPAWQYIVARVQQQYPDTIFLLEGLGGAWSATEALLTEGGMQWAYSELFQNYTGSAVAEYLDHCLAQTPRVGLLVHYSETHDNERLAAKGRAWSLLRNRLCALASASGGFGFTCGVEWLATEKIRVHDRTSMNWNSPTTLIPEISALNRLLADHPCFFDGARLSRLSPKDSPVYALARESQDGLDQVLILVNTSVDQSAAIGFKQTPAKTKAATTRKDAVAPMPPVEPKAAPIFGEELKFAQPVADLCDWIDLLGQPAPTIQRTGENSIAIEVPAGAAYCLAPSKVPQGLSGEQYRRLRSQAGWGIQAISQVIPAEAIPALPWRELASAVDRDPIAFLTALGNHDTNPLPANFLESLTGDGARNNFPQVICWTILDAQRITLVPPNHWLLVQDIVRFRATLKLDGAKDIESCASIASGIGHIACFSPRQVAGGASLELERYTERDPRVTGTLKFLAAAPDREIRKSEWLSPECIEPADLVLLTNGRGGMARIPVDLGRVNSKYDCVLAANLHPTLPVDRHVFAKRLRLWVNADGFISALDFRNLRWFSPGPPARWHFVASAGDGRTVEVQVSANMLANLNTTALHFSRPTAAAASGKQLPQSADVRLTARVDVEDRNFHWETKRNGGAEHHFSNNIHSLPSPPSRASVTTSEDGFASSSEALAGFAFTPAQDRSLRVFLDYGTYHPQPEWSENLPHPVEQSRGQTGAGDAFSPGWFEVPLAKGASATLIISADGSVPEGQLLEQAARGLDSTEPIPIEPAAENRAPSRHEGGDAFSARLLQALRAFVVTRGTGKTVIAGYPWFLDWGRDTFIAARGLLSSGMIEDVTQLLLTFGRFEQNGTLPNTIFGEDASNRDTSDAPLWFGVVCEELNTDLDALSPLPGRNLHRILESIASNYIKGTPNRIRMDPESSLIWSPAHFTWMDTNYPACTPREGYPVEIQALWIRLLQYLAKLSNAGDAQRWTSLADKARSSVETLFWQEEKGYYADVLSIAGQRPAREAAVDDALRSNCLFLVSLGIISGERARRCVLSARRYLVVPGALRSLAPLSVKLPLANYGNGGQLLNDPAAPYWGHYEGDEDTRRKPAYHNGTAWTWTFPVFCEALARAWDFSPASVSAARAYLATMDELMDRGCLGQLPEIVDGDAPHTQRGCDAQAWSATEAFRVWKLLQ
jgi:starch synthase (maltosyl-transferring)